MLKPFAQMSHLFPDSSRENPQMLRPLIRFILVDWHLHLLLVCSRGDPKGSDPL